jgi:hypothetical protein
MISHCGIHTEIRSEIELENDITKPSWQNDTKVGLVIIGALALTDQSFMKLAIPAVLKHIRLDYVL